MAAWLIAGPGCGAGNGHSGWQLWHWEQRCTGLLGMVQWWHGGGPELALAAMQWGGKDTDRRIFKNTDYDQYEKEQLSEFKKALKKYQIQLMNWLN